MPPNLLKENKQSLIRYKQSNVNDLSLFVRLRNQINQLSLRDIKYYRKLQ